MGDRIQHIVLLQFPESLSVAEEQEILAQMRTWPAEIGGFTKLRFGKDTSGRSRGYQYAIFSEFESEDRLRAYTPHPVHQRFKQWVDDRGAQVLAFDYALTPETVIVDGSPVPGS